MLCMTMARKFKAMCLLLLWLPACQRTREVYFGSTVPHHDAQTLWINNGGEPEWIDPGKCADGSGGAIIENLFAGLVDSHPQTLEPLPDIAQSWDISPDKLTYTFHLRPTVWSDGRPLTAEDFAYSWRRVLDPNTASHYGTMLHVFKNAAAYNEGAVWVTPADGSALDANALHAHFMHVVPVDRVETAQTPAGAAIFVGGEEKDKAALTQRALSLNGQSFGATTLQVTTTDASRVNIDALDAQTLQVRLVTPVPYFLSLIAYHVFKPVPRHVIDDLIRQGKNADLWTRPEYIVSNGAYLLTSWHFKHYFTYEKNPRYWNADKVSLAHVKVFEVDNNNTALNLYHAGELDWLGPNTPLPAEFMSHLAPYKDAHLDANLSVYFYWFNTREPPLDNVLLRRALSLAIDRESLVKYIARGGQVATADLVPDGVAGYVGLKSPLFDPNQALQLLHAAGYAQGAAVPPITLIYNTQESHKQIAEAVQAMWFKYLGVEVLLENQEWKVFLKNIALHNFQLARLAWTGDYPDANSFLHDLLTRHAGNNLSGYNDLGFDALIDQANSQRDPNVRLGLLRQAEARAMAAAPMIPLYVYTRSTLRKPFIRGFWPNYLDRHPLKYMSVDERWFNGVPQEAADTPRQEAR